MIIKGEGGSTCVSKSSLKKGMRVGYTAYVPSLSGCISEGETKEEALKTFGKQSSYTWNTSMTIGFWARRIWCRK